MAHREKNLVILTEFKISSSTPLPESVEAFLQDLQQARYIVLDGLDNTRTRVLITLQHGNEPSGVMAVLRWLKEAQQQLVPKPAVRIICIIASVQTALTGSLFYYRTLPGERDLNRCFRGHFEDKQGKLAQAILHLIDTYQPETIIDVHNTSGTGAAFGVAISDHVYHHSITQLFSDKLIIKHVKIQTETF